MDKKPKKAKDRHASAFMVRLPRAYRDRLKKLCAVTLRAMTVEVQLALDKHFEGQAT